jgi:hypothetical protein
MIFLKSEPLSYLGIVIYMGISFIFSIKMGQYLTPNVSRKKFRKFLKNNPTRARELWNNIEKENHHYGDVSPRDILK